MPVSQFEAETSFWRSGSLYFCDVLSHGRKYKKETLNPRTVFANFIIVNLPSIPSITNQSFLTWNKYYTFLFWGKFCRVLVPFRELALHVVWQNLWEPLGSCIGCISNKQSYIPSGTKMGPSVNN